MAAKAGLTRDDRRTLGGHVAPNDKTVDVYARDTLAAPLLALALLLKEVREGAFDPDSSRSGRWWKWPSMDKCAECDQRLA